MIDKKTAVSALRCESCKYFHPHYGRYNSKRYYPVGWGHCSYPRIKIRYCGEGCPHHISKQKEPPEP